MVRTMEELLNWYNKGFIGAADALRMMPNLCGGRYETVVRLANGATYVGTMLASSPTAAVKGLAQLHGYALCDVVDAKVNGVRMNSLEWRR